MKEESERVEKVMKGMKTLSADFKSLEASSKQEIKATHAQYRQKVQELEATLLQKGV